MFIAKDDNIERIMDVNPRVCSPFSPFFSYVQNVRKTNFLTPPRVTYTKMAKCSDFLLLLKFAIFSYVGPTP